ncbi:hypothetical protein D9M70_494390 [compost metagenome]
MQAHAGVDLGADGKALGLATLALDDRAGALGIGIHEAAAQGQAQVGGGRRGVVRGAAGAEQAGEVFECRRGERGCWCGGGNGGGGAQQANPIGGLPGQADTHGNDQQRTEQRRRVAL